MCCTQAKLALPAGGTLYFSACPREAATTQSLTLNGGLQGYSRLEVRVAVIVEVSRGQSGIDAADGEVHLGQPQVV